MTAINVPHRVAVSLDQVVDASLARISHQLDQLAADVADQRRQQEALFTLVAELADRLDAAATRPAG